MKRIRWSVKWDAKKGRWQVRQGTELKFDLRAKSLAIQGAAAECNIRHRASGECSELFIYNKNGRIGTGSSGRRTYGKDPKGSKG